METSLSSCNDANSPITEIACSSVPVSPVSVGAVAAATIAACCSNTLMCPTHLMYDQHSSEEELEVINGPSSANAANSLALCGGSGLKRDTASSSMVSTRGCISSLDAEEHYYEADGSNDGAIAKRSSSTMIENRKRSLAHSSDDELRNFIEPILTPVNFRTSPPLEAFKPNRSHMFRSTTPLILSEARCGIENMKLCDSSIRSEAGNGAEISNGGGRSVAGGIKYISCNSGSTAAANAGNDNEAAGTSSSNSSSSVIKMKMSNSSHHIYQPQPKYSFHYNSSRSSPASTTGLDKELRSVSPPAKLFHCAISPRRRPMRSSAQQQHATQRLQRPHRPCLDFDKMQQVSL